MVRRRDHRFSVMTHRFTLPGTCTLYEEHHKEPQIQKTCKHPSLNSRCVVSSVNLHASSQVDQVNSRQEGNARKEQNGPEAFPQTCQGGSLALNGVYDVQQEPWGITQPLMRTYNSYSR